MAQTFHEVGQKLPQAPGIRPDLILAFLDVLVAREPVEFRYLQRGRDYRVYRPLGLRAFRVSNVLEQRF